ncbi:lipase family protein [Duganella sp. S19_KUP01_CR8]|uniref:lipase family protein n=1 Tax=Duganella sp. S19_KUP01_CR8 TaxID=3025502 RepID=UPI002FCD88A1
MEKHKIKLALLLVVTGLFAGCTATGNQFPTVYESARTSAGDAEKTLTDAEAIAAMARYVPYAKMSEAVYRRELRGSTALLATACDYVASSDPKTLALDLPKDWIRLDRKMMITLGMEPAGAAEPLRPCRGNVGLEYETYVKLDPAGRPLEATIAFRGTENIRRQWLNDWVANFSNVDFGVGGNAQFKEARAEGMRMIEALARVLPKTKSTPVCTAVQGKTEGMQVPIELTGHSLGGGLAQHLAYSVDACLVRSTITFDPSPATGWFFLKWRKAVIAQDPIIHRVYIDGEALSFVRGVSTKFNLPRENRVDVRIAFPAISAGPSGRHSMTLLYGSIESASNWQPAAAPAPIDDYASTVVHPEVSKIN